MIEKDHPHLSIRKQAEMLGVNRNRLDPKEHINDEDRAMMRDLDELHTRQPVYGQRKLTVELRKIGWKIGRKRVRRLMEIMGIAAIAPKPRTSVPNKSHRTYPYLLRDREVSAPDEVWCADITYIPMRCNGFLDRMILFLLGPPSLHLAIPIIGHNPTALKNRKGLARSRSDRLIRRGHSLDFLAIRIVGDDPASI